MPPMQSFDGLRIVRGPLFKSALLLTPALFICLLKDSGEISVGSLYVLFANFFLYLFFAYVVNDYADRDHDLASGKHRLVALLPRPVGLGLAVGLAAGSLAVGYAAAGWGLYLLVLCAGLFCGAAYSVKPVRVKERGLWGVGFAAVVGKVIPILMVCALYRKTGW